MDQVRKMFRPEFLNRLDDVIVFKPLTKTDLEQIIHLEMAHVSKRIAKKDLVVTVTQAAIDYILKKGYNPEFGARPLRRAVEQLVEDPISEGILRDEYKGAKEIAIDFKDGKLVFTPIAKGDLCPNT